MTSATGRNLLTLVMAAMLAACSPAGSEAPRPVLQESHNPVLLDGEEIMAEYRAETGRLELAPGDDWDTRPAELTSNSPDPEGAMMFEQGMGAQTAQFKWYCSWATVALSDEGSLRKALAQLEKFPTLSVWRNMDHVGHALFTGIHDDAVLGELIGLADYVADNCDSESSAAAK